MMKELGHVCELVRYPVKSMAGTATESAFLGWHGLDGDRRFAFRKSGDNSGFPWLSASRVAELLLYHPFGLDESSGEPLPTHVRTPAGTHVELRSVELQNEIANLFGSTVELMNLKHGIFDDALISLISLTTIAGIGGEAGVDLDRRRFRANIVLETHDHEPFLEDAWVWRNTAVRQERTTASRERHGARRAMYDDQPRSGHGHTRRPGVEDSRPSEQEQCRRLRNGGANRYNPRWRSSKARIRRA